MFRVDTGQECFIISQSNKRWKMKYVLFPGQVVSIPLCFCTENYKCPLNLRT